MWECADLNGQVLVGGCPEEIAIGERIWPRIYRTLDFTHDNFSWILFKEKETINAAWAQCEGLYFGNVAHAKTHRILDPNTVDIHTDYACTNPNDSSSYIVDKPTHTWTEEGGNKLDEKWFLYDEQSTLGAFSSPARGNVTKVLSWVDQVGNVIDDGNDLESCPGSPQTCIASRTHYDLLGNATSVLDAFGGIVTTTYDSTQIYAFEVSNPTGHAIATSYDPSCGALISQTVPYPAGSSPTNKPKSENTYDEFCRLSRSSRPDENISQQPGAAYCYALGGAQQPTMIRVLRREPNFTSGSGALSDNCSESQPTVPAGYIPTWALADGLGRPLQAQTLRVVEGALTTVVTNAVTYDIAGRIATRYSPFVDPDGGHGEWSDPDDADPNEAGTTQFQYDSIGRVISTTNPASKTRTANHMTAWQTTTYDECYADPDCAGGKLVEIRDAFDRIVEKHFYEQDTLKAKTRYTYDGLGRLRTTEQWDGTSWNPATRISMVYDSLGRKTSMTDPDTGDPMTTVAGEWQYWYDVRGNLRVQEDPKPEQHVQLCYDELNRPKRKYVFQEADYGSNLVDCATSPQPPSTKIISYEYDGYQGGQQEDIANSIGRLTFVSDPSGETLFDEFDTRGRLLDYRKRLAVGSSLEEARFMYSYDAANHLDVLTYPDMEQVRFGYDASGQAQTLKSLTYAGSSSIYLADRTYDRFGRPRQISHGNTTSSHQVGGAVVAETREYWEKDKNFLLKRVTVAHSTGSGTAPTCGTSSNGPYLQLTYNDYTATNQLRSVIDLHQSCAVLSNQATYTYDGLGRLYEVTGSQFNGIYRYDDLGNMDVMGGSTFLYNNNARPHQVTAALGQNIAYDHNGNRAANGGRTYDFDEEDRLQSIDIGGVDVTYDYTGRQVLRQNGAAAPLRYFDALAEYEAATTKLRKHYFVGSMRLATRENYWAPTFIAASGWPTVMVASLAQSSPAVVLFLDERAQRYVGLAFAAVVLSLLAIPDRRRHRGGVSVHPRQAALMTLLWTLGTLPVHLALLPLSARSAWAGGGGGGPPALPPLEYYHYHGDHLDSTQLLTDEIGKVKQHIRYKPFGQPRGRYRYGLQSDDANSKRFEFTGYETETYSGLQYAGARFYEPTIGMFLSHDPARQFASPYTYTNWDPVNLTDPNGACVLGGIDCGIIAAVLITAAAIAVSIDTYVQTGSIRASVNAGLLTGALGTAAAGLGVLASPVYAGLTPALQLSVQLSSVGSGVYGVYQAANNGYVASAVVGSLGAALAAYGLGEQFIEEGTDSSQHQIGAGKTLEERNDPKLNSATRAELRKPQVRAAMQDASRRAWRVSDPTKIKEWGVDEQIDITGSHVSVVEGHSSWISPDEAPPLRPGATRRLWAHPHPQPGYIHIPNTTDLNAPIGTQLNVVWDTSKVYAIDGQTRTYSTVGGFEELIGFGD